jgi:hypothetical protein
LVWGHDTLGLVLRNWKGDNRGIGDLFVQVSDQGSGFAALQDPAARIAAIWIALESAICELPNLENTIEDVAKAVQASLGFDFIAIQLKNLEEQTIDTVYGRGLTSEWFGLAKHTIQGDRELWDIQADVVMHRPPRIEILAGYDRRFDEYIFKKFHHENQVRVFGPIILLPQGKAEGLHWEMLEVQPNVDSPSCGNRRVVLQVRREDWREDFDVIGTFEAGFHNPNRDIPAKLAQDLAAIATASLGNTSCIVG